MDRPPRTRKPSLYGHTALPESEGVDKYTAGRHAGVGETCGATSVLSDLFIRYYDQSYADAATSARHFGLPPAGWRPLEENRETPVSGLGQGLVRTLRSYDIDFHSSLTRQFEFERAKLRELYGDSPNHASRLRGTRQEGFHPGWYTRSDEIAASAYLRTLASAESDHGIPGT